MSNSNPANSFVLFELAGSTCAVRSQAVQWVDRVEHVTRVPNTLPFVEGVTLTRGRVIAGINLRSRLGFPRIPLNPKTRMLVVRSKTHSAGILVDSAREFVSIPPDAIEPDHETCATNGIGARYVDGIATLGDRVVVILNVEEVIAGVL